jgi:hypothetical protein
MSVSARAATLAIAACALASGAAIPAQAGEGHVVYYSLSNGEHTKDTFPFKVLKLALEKSGVAYDLEPSPAGVVTEQRATEIMTSGGKIDVEWVGANRTSGEVLSPIMFPIDGGLLGYRLFLIDGARQGEFSQVKSLDDLKKFLAIQGKGWPDVGVLRKSGMRLVTASNREKIYQMTLAGRADYFPRGAFEAFSEQEKYGPETPGLAVEKTLVLHYPLTFLFYVQKSNKQLHDDLYRGLMAAVNDGSYKKLFLSDPDIKSAIERAQFKSRRILDIDNPNMPDDVKAIDKKFWFQP